MRSGQKFGIGTSQRPGMVSRSISTVPGPGNYRSSLFNKTQSPNYGFGSSQRIAAGKSILNVPGPGSYPIGGLTGKEGNANSMHSKLEYKPIHKTGGQTPGPGTYESTIKNKKKDPSWGYGTEKRKFNASSSIAPASNTYNPGMNLTQKAEARWVFGSEERKGPVNMKSNIAPGPGNY